MANDWHILVKTRGGTVSLLKNLTEEVARETMQRLTPYWRRPDVKLPQGGVMYVSQDSDIEQLEAFGPEGRVLDIWPNSGGEV